MEAILVILALILAVLSFIAGLYLSKERPDIKEKIAYFSGQKKKLEVFTSRELEIDKEKQRQQSTSNV